MPSVATNDQKTKSRKPGQASKVYFAARLPNVIYTAQLATPPSSNNMIAEISFSSGAGTLANVKADMKLLVGTTAGGDELGEVRIRKAPIAGTFYIGEYSAIDWLHGGTIYLTVVDDFDMFAKHLRMDGTTPKMDYDISYSNQHSVYKPIPVLGPVIRVKKLTGASVVVQLGPETIHASTVFDSTIASYLWSCSTAVSFSNNGAVRPTATFNTTGWHVVYCLVTAANGAQKTGVRFVYIWSDDNPPLSVFDLEDFAEEFQDGGCRFSVSIQEPILLTDIPRRALSVLFTEDYYGIEDEQEQICIGHVVDAENILAVGRIVNESSTFNGESGTSVLEVEGYHSLMKKISGFPVGVEISGISSAWTNMAGLNVDRGLWHLLEWRSTATTIMDVVLTGDTRYTKEINSPSTNLWAQMEEIAFAQILANVHVDHMGRLFVEIDPLLTPEADRDYPVIMELEKQDLMERLQFDEQIVPKAGQISTSGIAVTLGGSGLAYFGLSPGNVFGQFGGVEPIDRLLLSSQAQANQLAGLIYAARNNELQIRIKLNHNNRLITCFPNQAVTVSVDAEDNPRGVSFTKNFIPRRRKLSIDEETGFLETELELEAETEEMISVNGLIPGSGDFSIPPLPGLPPFPSFPPILLPGSGSVSESGPKKVIAHDDTLGLVMTNDFDTDTPTWFTINAGLTVDQYQKINRIVICPSGAIYVGKCFGGDSLPDKFIARAPFAGAPFVIVEDDASIRTKLSTPSGPVYVTGFECNPIAGEEIVYGLCNLTIIKLYRSLSGAAAVAGATIANTDPNNFISYGLGKWVVTGGSFAGNAKMWVLPNDVSAVLATYTTPDDFGTGEVGHVRVSTSGEIYHYGEVGTQTITKSQDNGASFVNGIGANYTADPLLPDGSNSIAMDPTGQFLMCRKATSGRGKSSDYGATLVDISPLPFVGQTWQFCYAGDVGFNSRWIAASTYLMYSDDFGSTWADKQGNLPFLNPLFYLDLVKVLEY